MPISTADFRTGLTIEYDGAIFQIIEFQHVKPGKGGAFVRSRLRNLRTGAVIDKTFRAGERMEQAIIRRNPMQYLYRAGDDYVFMDMETFDQITLGADAVGDGVKYLKPDMEVAVISFDEETLGVELPNTVELAVAPTDPWDRDVVSYFLQEGYVNATTFRWLAANRLYAGVQHPWLRGLNACAIQRYSGDREYWFWKYMKDLDGKPIWGTEALRYRKKSENWAILH